MLRHYQQKGKSLFFGTTANFHGMLERHRLLLQWGKHTCAQLQTSFNIWGEDSFSFKVLEMLKKSDEPDYDYKGDLEILALIWSDKLRREGFRFYNESTILRIF